MRPNLLLRRIFWMIIVLLSPGSGIRAQAVDATTAAALQQTLNTYRTQNQVKGISAAAYIPGQGFWKGASGISHVGALIDTNMTFAIASVTKTLVAAEIFRLIEDNQLTLDDTLGDLLPARNFVSPSITVRQLLGHKSGLGEFLGGPWSNSMSADPYKIWTAEETLDSFLIAPTGAPGSGWQYVNTNYILLGMIIEAKKGDSLHKVLRTDFLQPLQMNNTYMRVREAMPNLIPHNWASPTLDPTLASDESATPHEALWSTVSAAGGYFSTAEDMVHWCKELYSGTVLQTSSVVDMLDFTNINGSYFTGYGLGSMRFQYNGRIFWGHGGNYYGYAASILFHPESGTCVAMLVNQDCLSPNIAGPFLNELINMTTAVTGVSQPRAVQIAPNPAHDKVRVSLPTGTKSCEITVRDILGKTVLHQKVTGAEAIIDVSGYPKGVYQIGIAAEGRHSNAKFVVD